MPASGTEKAKTQRRRQDLEFDADDFAGKRDGHRSRRDPAAAEGGDQARRRDRHGRRRAEGDIQPALVEAGDRGDRAALQPDRHVGLRSGVAVGARIRQCLPRPELLANEIKLFREFTLKQPVVATTTLDVADDKRLMFASLCGSNNYFGEFRLQPDRLCRGRRRKHLAHGLRDRRHASLHSTPSMPMAAGRTSSRCRSSAEPSEPTHWAWSGERIRAARPDHGRRGQGPGTGRHRAIGRVPVEARPSAIGLRRHRHWRPACRASCRPAARPPASRRCRRTCRRRSAPAQSAGR